MGRNIRGGDPKERIMKAAKKEFSERGFSGARMSEIAKGAGVNKALIHYYFKDKETLYTELLRRVFRGTGKETEDKIPEFMGKWDLSPSQRLFVIIYMMSNIFLRATDPDIMRIFFWEMAEGTRYLDAMMQEYTMPRQKIINDIVLEGIRTGEFETDFPKFAALNIGTFISFYTIHRELHRGKPLFRELYGDVSDQDVFQFVLESVFKSLKPKNKKLEIPKLPAELKKTIDDMLTMLIEKMDEGVTEEVMRQVETILHK
jgi:TetR/AcrR family transcriptional regulator